MDKVSYDHGANLHTNAGAAAGMSYLRDALTFSSLLDVGAGTGSWLKAALDSGVTDVLGIDGVSTCDRPTAVRANLVQMVNFETPFRLNRTFDLVLCLEVAEHLSEGAADTFVESLCHHANQIAFSAACPGQAGQTHINCQWPQYWQEIFNKHGFQCEDRLRHLMWNDKAVEPWYRQNIFVAKRDANAGKEPRLRAIIHPDMMPGVRFAPQHIHAYMHSRMRPQALLHRLQTGVTKRILATGA